VITDGVWLRNCGAACSPDAELYPRRAQLVDDILAKLSHSQRGNSREALHCPVQNFPIQPGT